MVNRGEEKVRVHMNVVPRSTMSTNGETHVILMNANAGLTTTQNPIGEFLIFLG